MLKNSSDLPYTPIVFPYSQEKALNASVPVQEMEKLLNHFCKHWQDALTALLPKTNLVVALTDLQVMPYEEFVLNQPEFADYQVFENQALETLCVWGLDFRLVPMAVDFMFGGQGNWPAVHPQSKSWTPVERKIRQRIWESLANAYEMPWQSILPQRLRALREESKTDHLRMVQSQSMVFAAKISCNMGAKECSVSFCLPWANQLEVLWKNDSSDLAEAVWGKELRHQLRQTPLEATAVIASLELKIADLLRLSVGQIIPIQLAPTADVQIEGKSVLIARPGVKNGQYAVKVEGVLDDLDRLIGDHSAGQDVEKGIQASSMNSPETEKSIKTITEAFQGFDQQVAQGAADGQN